MASTTTQIVREAPEVEKYKLGLLESAKALADTSPTLPGYEIAGMSPEQLDALQKGREGIGAYAPYMESARASLGASGAGLGTAMQTMQGADTRSQFTGAQAALEGAAAPISRMGGLADAAGQGVSLIGQGAAGTAQAQQMAQAAAQQQGFGTAESALGAGIGALGGAAQRFSAGNIQEFMNPYQQQVIDEALRQINRQGAVSQQNLQAQAIRSGAFGGSREGVQRAELERGLSEQRNAAIVGGLQQGYQSAGQMAQQAFEQQQQRQLAQAQGYQNAANIAGNLAGQQGSLGMQAAGLYGNLAGQQANMAGLYGNIAAQQAGILGQQAQLGQAQAANIGNLAAQQFNIGSQLAQGIGSLGVQQGTLGMQQAQLGQQAQGMGQQDVSFLYNLGQMEQAQRQRELDARRATELQTAYQPYQNVAFLSDIYRGAPSSQMSVTTASQPSPSAFQQIAGVGTGILSTGAAAKAVGAF